MARCTSVTGPNHGQEPPLARVQADNLLAILGAACGNGQMPLRKPDWDALARAANSQMLTALFYAGASQYADFVAWLPERRERLRRETVAQVGSQAMRTQRFLGLYQALLEAGLRPLVLKGIVCRSLYGRLADWRPSGDEDLYLPPEQVFRCRAVLEANGWCLSSHADSMAVAGQLQEIGFSDSGGLLYLEIHPTLFGTESLDQLRKTGYFINVETRACACSVEGVTLYTLGPTDHYIYLFLHLAKHFANGGVGVRQILDLMQFQRAWAAQIDWGEVRRAVEAYSFPGLYADAVELGRRMGFGEADPIFAPVDPDALLADSLEGGVYGHDRAGGGRGNILNVAAQYPTRLGRLRRLLFPSVEQLLEGRPWLEKRPWLLPVAWIQRAGRLFHSDERYSRITGKSLKAAYGRLELMRAYGILKGGRRKDYRG